VTDTRASSPDGTDTVRNFELFKFADGTLTLAAVLPPPVITSNGGGDSAAGFGVNSVYRSGAPLYDFVRFRGPGFAAVAGCCTQPPSRVAGHHVAASRGRTAGISDRDVPRLARLSGADLDLDMVTQRRQKAHEPLE
jgi:hypothetical protein